MMDIKKQNGNAVVAGTVAGVDYLEQTITNMVQYVKDVKAMDALEYGLTDEQLKVQHVANWLMSDQGVSDLDANNLVDFAKFVEVAGKDANDNYNVLEQIYMYEETRSRLNDKD